MASLLEELREHEANYPALIHGPLCGKAADTIDAVNAMLVDQQGEIERFRAALERIRDFPFKGDEASRFAVTGIARDALDHNQTGPK